jgi:hypothetical protein
MEKRKASKVAIVGFASNWDKAPFKDPDFEIWGLNELYKLFNMPQHAELNCRADRWFEIHSRQSPSKNTEEHISWLQQCTIPAYMWQHYDDMPSSLPFPKDEVLEFVASKGLKLVFPDGTEAVNDYVTNSISWMVLFAWMLGFEEIHIYGVDLAQNEEYLYQRPNLEYYIGAMQATGIKIVMPETCDLLKAALLYGFQSDNKMRIKMREHKKSMKNQQNGYMAELQKFQLAFQEVTAKVHKVNGQLKAIEDMLASDHCKRDAKLKADLEDGHKQFMEEKVRLVNEVRKNEAGAKQCEAAIHQLNGGMDVVKYFLRNWAV